MAKTQWIGYSRAPRTWLLDDGSTILEPLLETTPAGRRVRSSENPALAGTHYEANNIAFTAAMRKAKDRGRIILCEAHTLDMLKGRMMTTKFPTEPPLLHLTNDFFAVGGHSQDRMESDKTKFWTAWEHPTLPIHFITTNGIETSYYTADVAHGFYHLPLFPGLGQDPGEGLYGAPMNEVQMTLRGSYGNHPALSQIPALWSACELWQHYPVGEPTTRVLEGRREALRLAIIQTTQIANMEGLEIPDLWMAVKQNSDIDWQKPPTVELRKVGTNMDLDVIESFKAYVTGVESAAKAASLYRQMRNELTHAGIVLGDLSDDQFVHMLTNTTRPFTAPLIGARNTAEGKSPQSTYAGRRKQLTLSEQHQVVVDLATGYVAVGCPHGDNPESVPATTREAWDEALTIASLSGQTDNFIAFATELRRLKAENKVLTEALARRK